MSIHTVVVGVALDRPPTVDEYRRYVVEAEDPTEATLIALQMAACTSTMPVCCCPCDACTEYCELLPWEGE